MSSTDYLRGVKQIDLNKNRNTIKHMTLNRLLRTTREAKEKKKSNDNK